jgi:hypothetical protein
MRLGAIINVWGDLYELIEPCVKSIRPVSEQIILVWSESSNKGEVDERMHTLISRLANTYPEVKPLQVEPNIRKDARTNETAKRNAGIKYAYELFCSHFLMMDGDEFYRQHELQYERNRMERNSSLLGVVHPLKVFIGKPTLCCDDHTLVPGIHKLERNTEVGNHQKYPFAYDISNQAHIDPTRRVNITHGVIMSEHYMYHMSYVRKDIDMKIRNSTANLFRSEDVIKRDMKNACVGYVSELYHRPLTEFPNYFGL